MTTERVEEIREELTDLKEKKTKATTRIEDSQKRLKDEFDCNTLTKAKDLITSTKEDISKLEKKEEKLGEEIEELMEELE